MNYRVDHVLTDKQRFFVRYSRNNRVENRGNWTGEVNGILPTGNFLYRINDAVNVDHVWTMSSVVAAQRARRAIRGSRSRASASTRGFSIPPRSASRPRRPQYFGDNKYFPRFEFDDGSFADLGDSFAGGTNASIYSFQPTWTLIRGSHSFRSGGDFRAYREESFPSPHSAGRYDFGRDSSVAVHQAAGQLAGSGDRPGSRGHAARVAERRHHRPQHRSLQPGDLRRRVHPGRLEGEQQADAEPRPPLGVRRGADRARQPQRARLGSGRGAGDHRRRRRRPTRAIRSRRSPRARSASGAA